MDMTTIILWTIVIIDTILQYIEGYYYQKKFSLVLPIMYSLSILWLYFNGKNMTVFPTLLVLVLGNIWFYAYYTFGKNRHAKKINNESDHMKAKDNQN